MTPLSTILTNSELARANFNYFQLLGVKTVCVCPGARNSPWIELLENEPFFEVLRFFDERAAGFFALARAKETLSPVAVITTSGTAVGELLPAMMEAYYSASRLIALTADRPKRFRGTGAPQSCEQNQIFGVYARTSLDIDRESVPSNAHSIEFPFHLNVCFEEPLPSHESNRIVKKEESATFFKPGKFPLIILGELNLVEAEQLLPALIHSGLPVVTEALSQLRENSELDSLRIRPHREIWRESMEASYPIDSVIRFGGVPTLRFWRDLEVQTEASRIPVTSVSRLPFRGLPRASAFSEEASIWLEKQNFKNKDDHEYIAALARFKTKQDQRFLLLEKALEKFPQSEPAWIRALSKIIPSGSSIYLGNSLPIREWDLAAVTHSKQFSIRGNRGLNGIDGQISSFFGGLKSNCQNWAIIGDLTALYDLSAPWILNQLKTASNFKIVIVNNSGGKIFDRIFKSSFYTNQHSLGFEHWAHQWGLRYEKHGDSTLIKSLDPKTQVIEIIPHPEQTESFWNAWEAK